MHFSDQNLYITYFILSYITKDVNLERLGIFWNFRKKYKRLGVSHSLGFDLGSKEMRSKATAIGPGRFGVWIRIWQETN